MLGDGSTGSPSLHIRSFQLSQSNRSAWWSMVSAFARISADCGEDDGGLAGLYPRSNSSTPLTTGHFEPDKFED
jgi:hypothetical protein